MRDDPNPMANPMSKQIYMEREFHRAVLERGTYRAWAWIWFILAFAGWTALIAVAFKAGILHL